MSNVGFTKVSTARLQQISLRLFHDLAEVANRCVEGELPERGQPLPDDLNEKAHPIARGWLENGLVPSSPEDCAALFPRLWAAWTFVHNATIHGIHPASVGQETAIPAYMMYECWEQVGRPMWERAKKEHPWGG